MVAKDGKWDVAPFGFNIGTGPTEYEFTTDLPQPTLSNSDILIPGVLYLDERIGAFTFATELFNGGDSPHFAGDRKAIANPPTGAGVGGTAVTRVVIGGFFEGGTDDRLTETIVAWLADGQGDRICIVFNPFFIELGAQRNFSIMWSDAPAPLSNLDPNLHIHYEENPPTITSPEGPLVGTVGVLYTHPVTATDPTGQTVTFSLVDPLNGATVVPAGPNAGTILWTPTFGDDFLIQLLATDEDGFTDLQTWTVIVPPIIPIGPEGQVGGAIKVRPVTAGTGVTDAAVAGKIAAVAVVAGTDETTARVDGDLSETLAVDGELTTEEKD
jgi:hypothetical protein